MVVAVSRQHGCLHLLPALVHVRDIVQTQRGVGCLAYRLPHHSRRLHYLGLTNSFVLDFIVLAGGEG